MHNANRSQPQMALAHRTPMRLANLAGAYAAADLPDVAESPAVLAAEQKYAMPADADAGLDRIAADLRSVSAQLVIAERFGAMARREGRTLHSNLYDPINQRGLWTAWNSGWAGETHRPTVHMSAEQADGQESQCTGDA